MTTITINTHRFTIPASWDDMTLAQLVGVVNLSDMKLDMLTFKLKMLLLMTGWVLLPSDTRGVYVFALKWNKTVRLEEYQLNEVMQHLDFLIKQTDTREGSIYTIYSQLTAQKIRMFRIRGRRFYGPKDKLFNLRFAEYLSADNYFNRYFETHNEHFLDMLIATLYRPRKKGLKTWSPAFDGDFRQKYNSHLTETYAARVSNLDQFSKTVILLYYQGCKNHLIKQFPQVFQQGSGSRSRYGALGLVDALTNGDVTKTESIRSQYLYDVFVHLNELVSKNEEIKSKMKRGKL